MNTVVTRTIKLATLAVLLGFSANSHAGSVFGKIGYADFPWHISVGYSGHGHGYYKPRHYRYGYGHHRYYKPRHYYRGHHYRHHYKPRRHYYKHNRYYRHPAYRSHYYTHRHRPEHYDQRYHYKKHKYGGHYKHH